MSRIDQALQRARTADDASAERLSLLDTRSPSTPFVAPWTFSDEEGVGQRGAEGRSDAAEPRDGVAVPGPLSATDGRRELGEKLVSARLPAVPLEQYRKLAATLHHVQELQGTKVVMVASAVVGEGKSLTAGNLALTLSQSYLKHVLLVDADLRRPMLHELFRVPADEGLAELLGSVEERKAPLAEVAPRLSLLRAGRPTKDPMRLLTSERMRRAIAEAAAAFDWVVLDTPPIALLPDARLLADMVDGALLVVQAGRTPYPYVREAMEAIGRERVLGVVLNRVDDSAPLSAAYGGGYYQRYAAQGLTP